MVAVVARGRVVIPAQPRSLHRWIRAESGSKGFRSRLSTSRDYIDFAEHDGAEVIVVD
jgi:hypothetical protein